MGVSCKSCEVGVTISDIKPEFQEEFKRIHSEYLAQIVKIYANEGITYVPTAEDKSLQFDCIASRHNGPLKITRLLTDWKPIDLTPMIRETAMEGYHKYFK